MTKNRILSKIWFIELGISAEKMLFDLEKRIDPNSHLQLERDLFKIEKHLSFKFFRSYARFANFSKKDIFYVPEILKPFSSSDWVTQEEIPDIIDLYIKKTYSKTVMYGNDFSHSKTGFTIKTRILDRVSEKNINEKLEDITDAFMLKAPFQSAALVYKDHEEDNVYVTNLLSDTAIYKFEFVKNMHLKHVYLRKMRKAKNMYYQTAIICNYLNSGIIKIAI